MELYNNEAAKIKSLLKENPRGMSVTDISKHVSVNRNTVAKYLELLRISGHIEMENVGTAKVYFLSQRIPVSTLLNFSSDFIVVINDNNKVVQANDRFLELSKVSKNAIQGKKLCDVFPPMISNKTLLESIKDARNGNEQVETLDIFVDNELCFFKAKIIPSTFDDGENGVTLIMENITEEINSRNILKRQQEKLEILVSQRTSELKETNEMLKKEIDERKKIEEKLQDEHEKAQNYLNIAGVLIAVIETDGKCTLINKKGLDILEREIDDVIGHHFVNEFILEECRESSMKRGQQIFDGEKEINCESYIITPSGKSKLIKWLHVALKDKYGNVTGILSSGQDITEQRKIEEELKESERKYRLLAENTMDCIWTIDKDMVFTYVNPAVYDIAGYAPEEWIGTKLSDHFPENEMQKLNEIIIYFLENGTDNSRTRIESLIYNKEMDLVPIDIYGKMLFDEGGNYQGFQGTTRKIDPL